MNAKTAFKPLDQHNEHSQDAQKPALNVVGKPTPKGLVEIKAMLNEARHSADHVMTNVLNERERTIVYFAAGLSRDDMNKGFKQLDAEKRLKVQKAVLMLDEIALAFKRANAVAPAKFIEHAKPAEYLTQH
ncbi:hypothetical protein [Pseudoalteromonas tunicata]|uniref:Uncharacterized protein n=1 Tax=Pseudoalteromonas tunicata D2 TaxID=87626 RepID=A4C8R5_9GAMM|nr:hypothetical protein [Pseudoalteromonas tunicata]ATC93483.1 hypothetical protein PTUN_a0735 [Pseudoalteromonas tunicata]AXT32523.1 hypothetical protein D1819_17930 [Pseudoalteromonas tunicata]EAR28980.1 hypothetical protein PTD2_08049 [Pseudoalteromonas tunicata D2]